MTPDQIERAQRLLKHREGIETRLQITVENPDYQHGVSQLQGEVYEALRSLGEDTKANERSRIMTEAERTLQLIDVELRELGLTTPTKTWMVDLTSTATVSVQVEAATEDEARAKAAKAAAGLDTWEVIDPNPSDITHIEPVS